MLGKRMMLGVVPPGRTLWSNENAPIIFARIVPRRDGGCNLRLGLYRQGFPYRSIRDPLAEAFFNDWLRRLGSELGAA
jgi:hypothetical protein